MAHLFILLKLTFLMILRLFSQFFLLFFYIYLIKVEPILQHGIWFMWGTTLEQHPPFRKQTHLCPDVSLKDSVAFVV